MTLSCRRTQTARHAPAQRGVVLLTLMILLGLGGLASLIAIDVWKISRQREIEQELLFVGAQFTQAMAHYYLSAPVGQPRALPSSMTDLLEDPRYPVPVRHLRRVYVDPLTGENTWSFERVGRGVGVHSLADGEPLKQKGFPRLFSALEGKTNYREWVFVFTPPLITATVQAPPARTFPPPPLVKPVRP